MVRLSNRQYPMLQAFVKGGEGFYMRIHEAQHYDQRPFRSMLIQGWIAWAGKGFRLTQAGHQAWEEFRHTSIARKGVDLPLTRYFDPVAYGLTDPYGKAKKLSLVKSA